MSSWPTLPPHPNPARLTVQPDVQIAEHALAEPQRSGEVCNLVDFRATLAARIDRARSTSQPLIITQRGRGSAVLLGIEAFENLLREVEMLREVRAAEAEVAAGQHTEHELLAGRLRELLGR